jgi:hypothetical protein
MCEHTGPRHMIEEFTNGKEEFWMCCTCGEKLGRHVEQDTRNCTYIPDKHHWVNKKGEIISEYLPL